MGVPESFFRSQGRRVPSSAEALADTRPSRFYEPESYQIAPFRKRLFGTPTSLIYLLVNDSPSELIREQWKTGG